MITDAPQDAPSDAECDALIYGCCVKMGKEVRRDDIPQWSPDWRALIRAGYAAGRAAKADVPREVTCPHCGMPFEVEL